MKRGVIIVTPLAFGIPTESILEGIFGWIDEQGEEEYSSEQVAQIMECSKVVTERTVGSLKNLPLISEGKERSENFSICLGATVSALADMVPSLQDILHLEAECCMKGIAFIQQKLETVLSNPRMADYSELDEDVEELEGVGKFLLHIAQEIGWCEAGGYKSEAAIIFGYAGEIDVAARKAMKELLGEAPKADVDKEQSEQEVQKTEETTSEVSAETVKFLVKTAQNIMNEVAYALGHAENFLDTPNNLHAGGITVSAGNIAFFLSEVQEKFPYCDDVIGEQIKALQLAKEVVEGMSDTLSRDDIVIVCNSVAEIGAVSQILSDIGEFVQKEAPNFVDDGAKIIYQAQAISSSVGEFRAKLDKSE